MLFNSALVSPPTPSMEVASSFPFPHITYYYFLLASLPPSLPSLSPGAVLPAALPEPIRTVEACGPQGRHCVRLRRKEERPHKAKEGHVKGSVPPCISHATLTHSPISSLPLVVGLVDEKGADVNNRAKGLLVKGCTPLHSAKSLDVLNALTVAEILH